MLGGGAERKLDLHSRDDGRYRTNQITMPDEITPPPSTEPNAGSGLEPNVAAGLSCVILLIGGIIFLAIEKKNEYVRYWAAQSVVVGGVFFIYWIAYMVLIQIFIHIPIIGWLVILLLWLVGMLVGLGTLILWIMMMINAFGGKKWDVPFLAKYVPLVLSKFPTT